MYRGSSAPIGSAEQPSRTDWASSWYQWSRPAVISTPSLPTPWPRLTTTTLRSPGQRAAARSAFLLRAMTLPRR